MSLGGKFSLLRIWLKNRLLNKKIKMIFFISENMFTFKIILSYFQNSNSKIRKFNARQKELSKIKTILLFEW